MPITTQSFHSASDKGCRCRGHSWRSIIEKRAPPSENPARPSSPPAIGAGACLIMGKVIPGVAVLAVVFAHGTPLSFAEVGSPLLPGSLLLSSLCEASLLCYGCFYGIALHFHLVLPNYILASNQRSPGSGNQDRIPDDNSDPSSQNQGSSQQIAPPSLAVDFSSNVNLKIISTLICASLAGVLVFFVPGLALQKWMYPIGLVIGFLPIRIVRAKNSESSYWVKHLWVDTILILIFTSVVIFCATLATTNLW